MTVLSFKDDPVHAKAILLGATGYCRFDYIETVKGKVAFLTDDCRPSNAQDIAADTDEEALQKFIEYLRR
jgi:hypothetical protein